VTHLTFRATPEDAELLRHLAVTRGISRSQLLRDLLRAEAARDRGAEEPAAALPDPPDLDELLRIAGHQAREGSITALRLLLERADPTIPPTEAAAPEAATFRLSGALGAGRELHKGEEIMVTLADSDGQVIASGHGWVRGVGFREHRPKDGPSWTERTHQIKLED
jgi:hypothetical protein